MPATFRIHPAIGLARVGNSPSSFYIAPETTGAVPIDCDADGKPLPPPTAVPQPDFPYKDAAGMIRRQAARFRVYVYDDSHPEGRELKIGDELDVVNVKRGYQLWRVKITDVQWTVYLANKKASWYEFKQTDGEHGYAPSHPLRNADVTDVQDRQRLIIDPGPRTVSNGDPKQRRKEFTAAGSGTATFPPQLSPSSISTLGEIRCTQTSDGTNRLLVLGGHGNSGSMKSGFGDPKIESYSNNDGWFDDIADGPVTAVLTYDVLKISGQDPPKTDKPMTGSVAVGDPAWVIVGYPRYAPQIVDIVTLDDVLFDMAARTFAYAPYMYGIGPAYAAPDPPLKTEHDFRFWRDRATWNTGFLPYFWRDIWAILQRPMQYGNVMDLDPMFGGDPHDPAAGGPFDPADLAIAPFEGEPPLDRARRREKRMHVYTMLRKQGRENDLYTAVDLHQVDESYGARRVERRARVTAAQREGDHEPETPQLTAADRQGGGEENRFAMPLLCGDNPISNTAPSKFLRLTDTMLFMLGQWAHGKFINEQSENITPPPLHKTPGAQLDSGVISNALGGSFCPGAETCWIIRNPAIFAAPYRLRQTAKPAVPGALSHPAVLDPSPHANDSSGRAASLQNGLEPGDISKYDAIPWQADFNECSTQEIDVTYRDWNANYPGSTGDPVQPLVQLTYWWPAHRPMNVSRPRGSATPWAPRWSPTAQTNAGDLQMVTVWTKLGFMTPDGQGGFVCTQETL
jgi:hypothetical protein